MANMEKVITAGVFVLVILVVLMQLGSTMIPEVASAGDSLNDTARCEAVGCSYNSSNTPVCQATATNVSACQVQGQTIPLGDLFSGEGIVVLIVVVGLLIAVIGGGMAWAKMKK